MKIPLTRMACSKKGRLIILLFLSLLSTFSKASDNNSNFFSDIHYTIGGGLQFGGLFGAQFDFNNGTHKGYLSIGLGGAGVGYDFAVSDNISIGVNYTGLFIFFSFATAATVNINYHFGSTFKRGWVLGLDVGSLERIFGFDDNTRTNIGFISVGYRFN